MNPIFEAAGLTVFERGWLSSNNVLFDGREQHESVLVDSGYCTHSAQTVALVRGVLGGRGLQRVINTHLHSDHCGGNHALQAAFGCSIDIPLGEAEKVDRWDEDLLTYRATGQQCPRFTRAGLLRPDTEIRLGAGSWRVIATPGHDPESVVLYEPELEILISADALWENGFGVVFPELEGHTAFDAVQDTLDALRALQVSWIIPGHGAPFQGLQHAIDRAQHRLDAFVTSPAKHARHAGKVLIKFHLLERQRVAAADLLSWLDSTKYMRVIHALYFDTAPFRTWCLILIDELRIAGAISSEGGMIENI